MFGDGVVHVIEGTDIDRQRNAITLTPSFQSSLGQFILRK
jgi:hypothetical protein